ncbi:MAG: dephospho-CoA kinase [Clostridia bacterium]|nr:dephospho-CoA kinase [Clostridia bacterium]
MKVYGLTGKTGAGKSTVALKLAKLGFYIVDGDVIARGITEKGKPALNELANEFGCDIIESDGSLNRKLLASRAFKDKESTAKLNSITHPLIKKEFEAELMKAQNEGFAFAVIDAAALLESSCKDLCEKIIVVTAPEDIRLARILKRDNITKAQALIRINAQFPDEYYNEKADILIRNYPPFESNIDKQLKELTE